MILRPSDGLALALVWGAVVVMRAATKGSGVNGPDMRLTDVHGKVIRDILV